MSEVTHEYLMEQFADINVRVDHLLEERAALLAACKLALLGITRLPEKRWGDIRRQLRAAIALAEGEDERP
jgi:hypothetical protein